MWTQFDIIPLESIVLLVYARNMGVLAVQQIFTEHYGGSRNTVMNKKWFLPLKVLPRISNKIHLKGAFKNNLVHTSMISMQLFLT